MFGKTIELPEIETEDGRTIRATVECAVTFSKESSDDRGDYWSYDFDIEEARGFIVAEDDEWGFSLDEAGLKSMLPPQKWAGVVEYICSEIDTMEIV